jgi:hypothetical protein
MAKAICKWLICSDGHSTMPTKATLFLWICFVF